MPTIISPHRHQRIHDLRPGEAFDAACLYIHDSGRVACGEHVGIEASYQPQAWSRLGLGPTYTNPDDEITFACETCHPHGYGR